MTKERIRLSECLGWEGEGSYAGKLRDGKNSMNRDGMGFFQGETKRVFKR